MDPIWNRDEHVTWYLATCAECTPQLPQPFRDRDERNRWALAHNEGAGHGVLIHEDVRP